MHRKPNICDLYKLCKFMHFLICIIASHGESHGALQLMIIFCASRDLAVLIQYEIIGTLFIHPS